METGGYILHLTPFTATLYSESSHSCLTDLSFPAHLKLIELTEGARIEIVDQQLDLSVDGSLGSMRFDKLAALPAACGDPDPHTADLRDVFDATWAALDEHYAFFDLHGVDWDARRALAPDPGGPMPPDNAAVMEMLLELTDGLDDGHVHFGSDETGWDSPSVAPPWIPTNASFNRTKLFDIAAKNVGAELSQHESEPIYYALREDGIGYIAVREMEVSVPFGSTSTRAMAEHFAAVLDALSDAKAVVIDIRYNPGGSDTVSFGLASNFIAAPLNAFTKTTRIGDSQSEPFQATVMPMDDIPYTRPVVLLTSRLTGSAAEILTLVMHEIDHVTTLGEPTSGGLSDVMGFTLPNGWGLGLSNQTYLTMDGNLFEAVGIPPDVIVAFDAAPLLAGQDPVLAAGFEHALRLVE